MHQEHNIPWNLLAKGVKFVRENPAYTPRTTGFFTKSPNASELNHFVRAFISTIRTFSDTERAKYPSPWPKPFPTCGPVVYSNEVKAKHPEYLDGRRQRIENWIERAHRGEASASSQRTYSTSHADLADVVKILFAEASMETLLMLANHPEIPLGNLVQLSWGHHFGWSRVMESALRTYLLFNLILAVGTSGGQSGEGMLRRGDYTKMESYQYAYRDETWSMDHDAQQVPHRKFWKGAREADEAARDELDGEGGQGPHLGKGDPPQMHLDITKLKEYLKTDFALLYQYDMIIRECGLDPEWEREMVFTLRNMVRGFNINDGQWVESEGKWTPPVFT
ncbi:hypothetical protein FA13DRAFT_1644620 [Coprinellus micaceus]|uniref:Uncharacterized protein n=1 Tax=Coprinellus micaceus TaxID=71717 RepID=A0A4Y7SF69_COPMI|nr:hypothetical protein FA13DRAFT_1644620 [Coprinellus micaceus]